MAGTLTIDTLKASSGVFATQNAIGGIAQAWAYFTYISSTLSTVASYNVSSITRSATGVYVVTMTTALTDANYAVIGSCGPVTGGGSACNIHPNSNAAGSYVAPTSSVFTINIVNEAGTAVVDPYNCGFAIHR